MADFQPRGAAHILAADGHARSDFRKVNNVVTPDYCDFGAKLPYDPTAYLPTLYPTRHRVVHKVRYWWCG